MSRSSRKISRGLRSRAGTVAVVLAGLACIAWYAAVSVTVYGKMVMCSGVFEFWGARWRRSVMEGASSAWLVEKLAYCRT